VRVLHVSCVRDPLNRTGKELLDAWPTLPQVAEAVRDAGAEVTVLQAAHADASFEHANVAYRFVAEPRLPGRQSRAGLLPWRLARAAAELRPDVVHLNGLGFPLHARALAGVGPPVLAQDHASAAPRHLAPLHRWGHAHVAAVSFTSREQAEPFFRAGVLRPGTPVFEVPESSSRFTPGSVPDARAATGLHGDPVLLWVGRLNDNKDPLTILRALSRAVPRLRDPQLWCVFHESPLLERVRERINADPALAGRVHLVGRVPHARIEELCRAADFFLAASHRESSGYALLEALACGATPVVSDIPSFRAVTGGGAVGALAPPGDAEAFADALVALAGKDRDQLRDQAVTHFRRELSFPVLGRRLVDAYRAIVESRASVSMATMGAGA
jgi:glycosyltransferase involved in cell wall biosynthesis